MIKDLDNAESAYKNTNAKADGDLNNSISRAQAFAATGDLLSKSLSLLSSDPKNQSLLEKIIREAGDGQAKLGGLILNSGYQDYVNQTKPKADEIAKAKQQLAAFNAGEISKLNSATLDLAVKQLVTDPEFAKLAQPKKVTDSYAALVKAEEAYNKKVSEIVKALTTGDLSAANKVNSYQKDLAEASQKVKDANDAHTKTWNSYVSDVKSMISTRTSSGDLSLTSVRKVSEGLVKVANVSMPANEKYTVYKDDQGNVALIGNADSVMAERYRQKQDFASKMEIVSKESKVKVNTETGEITRGIDGKYCVIHRHRFNRFSCKSI